MVTGPRSFRADRTVRWAGVSEVKCLQEAKPAVPSQKLHLSISPVESPQSGPPVSLQVLFVSKGSFSTGHKKW